MSAWNLTFHVMVMLIKCLIAPRTLRSSPWYQRNGYHGWSRWTSARLANQEWLRGAGWGRGMLCRGGDTLPSSCDHWENACRRKVAPYCTFCFWWWHPAPCQYLIIQHKNISNLIPLHRNQYPWIITFKHGDQIGIGLHCSLMIPQTLVAAPRLHQHWAKNRA